MMAMAGRAQALQRVVRVLVLTAAGAIGEAGLQRNSHAMSDRATIGVSDPSGRETVNKEVTFTRPVQVLRVCSGSILV